MKALTVTSIISLGLLVGCGGGGGGSDSGGSVSVRLLRRHQPQRQHRLQHQHRLRSQRERWKIYRFLTILTIDQ